VALAVKYLQRRPGTFIKEMLPRIDRREVIRQDEDEEWICPKGEEVLQMARVLTIEEYVHSEEAGYNHEICGDKKYILWEVQKLQKEDS
jgi:methionyl-tRNA synthetase